MKLTDFHYTLPPELIAQTPTDRRDESRLLVVDRQRGTWQHRHFFDLPTLLLPNDVLVINNTRVLPARLSGHKSTGGRVEVLLTRRLPQSSSAPQTFEVWEALVRPGLAVGQVVQIAPGFSLEVIADQGYSRLLRPSLTGAALMAALHQYGEIPTPPYIAQFRGDPERYQTVYNQVVGSAAAPTAGLHFTPQLLTTLQERGLEIIPITLHVGLDTFLPVKATNVADHKMHAESYEVSATSAARLEAARQNGQRLIAVGTTSLRTLETLMAQYGHFVAATGETELFVYPPYKFRACQGLITNFHLPESTLLMLVSAFTSAPQTTLPFSTFAESLLGQAYAAAIAAKYRFFSFGDAMLVV